MLTQGKNQELVNNRQEGKEHIQSKCYQEEIFVNGQDRFPFGDRSEASTKMLRCFL